VRGATDLVIVAELLGTHVSRLPAHTLVPPRRTAPERSTCPLSTNSLRTARDPPFWRVIPRRAPQTAYCVFRVYLGCTPRGARESRLQDLGAIGDPIAPKGHFVTSL
jgi:hypothetical protein